MNENRDQLPIDPLDALLAKAQWPTLSDAALSRLTATLADERRSRRRPIVISTLAAAAAVAIGMFTWHLLKPQTRTPLAQTPPTTIPSAIVAPLAQPRANVGRESNAYERFAFASRATVKTKSSTTTTCAKTSQPKQTAVALAASTNKVTSSFDVANTVRRTLIAANAGWRSPEDASRLAAFIASAGPNDWPLVRDCLRHASFGEDAATTLVTREDPAGVDLLLRGLLDGQTRSTTLHSLRAVPTVPTAALLKQFDAMRIDQRLAAAVALGASGDVATLERLATMATTGVHRREALAALLSSSALPAQDILARLGRDPAVAPHVAVTREAVDALLRS